MSEGGKAFYARPKIVYSAILDTTCCSHFLCVLKKIIKKSKKVYVAPVSYYIYLCMAAVIFLFVFATDQYLLTARNGTNQYTWK